jgi:hypothetical protein
MHKRARTVLCGGRPAMAVPTATSSIYWKSTNSTFFREGMVREIWVRGTPRIDLALRPAAWRVLVFRLRSDFACVRAVLRR